MLSIGSRLSIRQVGYNYQTWARAAYVIVNDIDEEELKKPSVHSDMRIHADAADLLRALNEELDRILEEEKDSLPERIGCPGRSRFLTEGKAFRAKAGAKPAGCGKRPIR